METEDERPCVYIHADHNPDDVRLFFELPNALVREIQPEGSRETFCELLALRLETSQK